MALNAAVSALFALSIAVRAAVVRVPLSDHKTTNPTTRHTLSMIFFDQRQTFLHEGTSQGQLADTGLLSYGLEISVGTPPQKFGVILDLDFSTFFLESTCCKTTTCDYMNHTRFNASESSTYIPSKKRSRAEYLGMIFNGNLACDVLDIYGLKTPHTILDADDIYTSGWFSLYTNPVLGFARHRPGQSPSPWQSLVSGELLDRNVFSVVPIPGLRNNSKPRTGGELVIGAYPSSISDDDEKDAIRLPLKMNDEQYSWATSLEHMTFAGIRHSFPSNSTAFFSTVDCFILVPKAFGRLVLMWVGNYEPAGWFFVQFACEKRQKLPDWTFGIGGKNITLTPYQYVTEVVMIDYEDPEATPVTKCLLGLFPGGDYEVGLGWPFWEKFRGISFDEDSEIISLFP